MKKVILVTILFCGIVFSSNSQVLTKGESAINIGIGVPDVSGTIRIPAIIGIFDIGVTEKLGIGYISAGGEFAMSGGKYQSFGWKETTTNFIFGGRAAYHFDFLDISGNSAFDKMDIYAGFFLGVNLQKYEDEFTNSSSMNPYFKEDVFVGIRYSFSDAMAVYAEAGYNIAYISGGISFRL